MKRALLALMLLQLWVTCYDHAEVLRLRRDVSNLTSAVRTLQDIEFARQTRTVHGIAQEVRQDSTRFEEVNKVWRDARKNARHGSR